MVVVIDESGYTAAITHYEMQKQKILNTISEQFLSRAGYINQRIMSCVNTIEAEIAADVAAGDDGDVNTLVEQEMDALVSSVEESNARSLQSVYQTISNQKAQIETELESARKGIYNALIAQTRSLMDRNLNMQNFESQVFGRMNGLVTDSDLISSAMKYIENYMMLQNQLLSASSSTITTYKLRLRECYKKKIVNQAIEKHITHMMKNFSTSPRVVTIRGGNNPLKSVIEDMKKIEKIITYISSESVEVTSLGQTEQALAQSTILNKIESFASRIRSLKFSASGSLSLPIGDSSNLHGAFMNSVPRGYEYHWSEGVNYLAQYKSILQVFNTTAVMYNKQWISDFIRIFRGMGYYLSFPVDENHRTTSHIALDIYHRASKMMMH